MMKIKPIGNNILIEVEKEKEKTDSGIILTFMKEKKYSSGLIIAVGDDCKLKMGTNVIFKKYISKENNSFFMIDEEDVLAIIDNDNNKRSQK